MLTPDVGAELVLGVPPRIEARATGSVASLGDDVLSARNVAPTLIVNGYFGDPGSTSRPYVGLGINYTRFAGARSTQAPRVELSDSVGAVVQAGLDHALDRRWGIFAGVARVHVKSDLVAVGSTVPTTTNDFRPVTCSLGVWNRI